MENVVKQILVISIKAVEEFCEREVGVGKMDVIYEMLEEFEEEEIDMIDEVFEEIREAEREAKRWMARRWKKSQRERRTPKTSWTTSLKIKGTIYITAR